MLELIFKILTIKQLTSSSSIIEDNVDYVDHTDFIIDFS